MTNRLRQFIAAVALVLPSMAFAQVANIPGIYLSGSPPTGFGNQAFKMDCNNAVPTSGQCWPLIELYDAAGHQGTINADSGLNVHVINTNTNGTATMAGSSPVTMASDQSAMAFKPTAATTGGGTPTGNIVANNTTAVVVKASAGTLYSLQLAGIGAAPAYLKIYDATSATCGSGTPKGRYMIPAASTAANGAGSNIIFGAVGIAFATGITYCVTTGITDADATAPAASTFLVNLVWQ